MNISPKIKEINVVDLRVPTSDTLLGSDPFHLIFGQEVSQTFKFGRNARFSLFF